MILVICRRLVGVLCLSESANQLAVWRRIYHRVDMYKTNSTETKKYISYTVH